MSRAGRDIAGVALRFAVGVVLVWAGLGKCCHTMPVQGERAAALANLGLLTPPGAGTTQAPASPSAAPPTPAAEPEKAGQPGDGPSVQAEPGFEFVLVRTAAGQAAKPVPEPAPSKTEPAPRRTAPTYTSADFPNAVEVKRWHGVALALHEGQMNAQGRRLVPAPIATNGSVLRVLALSVSWIELIGGCALVIGAMTRMFALLGLSVVGGAMWLTQIGPALGAKDALLGVLPSPRLADPALATTAWAPFLLQLLTAACCFALVLLGPGRLSADHWFWGDKPAAGSDDEDDADDDDED